MPMPLTCGKTTDPPARRVVATAGTIAGSGTSSLAIVGSYSIAASPYLDGGFAPPRDAILVTALRPNIDLDQALIFLRLKAIHSGQRRHGGCAYLEHLKSPAKNPKTD